MKNYLLVLVSLGIFASVSAPAHAANVEQELAGPTGEKVKYVVSPQGSRLAAVGPKGSRMAVSVDGVVGPQFDQIVETVFGYIDPRPYVGIDHPRGTPVTFSRDGKRYAYVGRLSQEWVVMVDNKESFRIPAAGAVGAVAGIAGGAGNTDLRMEFTGPDGKHLLVAKSGFEGYELWSDGKKWPGTYASGGGGSEGTVDPIISPDGEHVAYVAQVSRDKRALIIDGKDAGYFGTRLHYTADSKHLVCVNESPKGHTVLVDGKPFLAARSVIDVFVPPAGNRLIVAVVNMSRDGNSAQGSVLVVDGKPVEATLSSELMIKKVVFSPDGKRYAAICGKTGNEFVVVDGKKGREYSIIYNQAMGDLMTSLTFSPDSKRVGYTAGTPGSGEFVVIDEEESEAVSAPWFRFSANGKRVAFGGRTNSGQKTLLVVDGKMVPLPAGWFIDSFTFSPDGSHYAFNGQKGGEKGVFLDGKNTGVAGDFAFSPDGKHLAVAGVGGPEAKGGLFVDGQLVFETYDKPLRYRGFTPDGQHLFWEAREPAAGAKAAPGVYEYVTYVDGAVAMRVVDVASMPGSNINQRTLHGHQIGSLWKMPPSWKVNPAGKLVFLAPDEDGIKRFGVKPEADKNVDTMIAEAREAPARAAAKAAEEKKKATEAAAAKKAKADADAAEAAAKAKVENDARVAKQKADYDAAVAKRKADYDAAMAKRKADYEALLAKQKADREAALAKQAELLKQQQKK